MEIQERIDEYQREQVSSVKVNMPKTHTTALHCHDARMEIHNTCETDTPSVNHLSPPALPLVGTPSLSPSPSLSQDQQQSLSPAPKTHQLHTTPLIQQQPQTLSSLPQCQRPPLPHTLQSLPSPKQQPGSDAMLGEMMSMLRELLAKVQTGDGRPAACRGGRQVRDWAQRVASCSICNDENHCRLDRLCFKCFRPGHAQRSCTARSSVRDDVQGN